MSIWVLGRADSSWPKLKMPIFLERISAGFPSPAQDYIEQTLDLNELCIERPSSTYFVKVQGDSMIEAGIYEGDILVVDRSLTPCHNQIVIASFDGELTVKQLHLKPKVRLMPRNKQYAPIEIPEGSELEIFGVVTNVLRNLVKKHVCTG